MKHKPARVTAKSLIRARVEAMMAEKGIWLHPSTYLKDKEWLEMEAKNRTGVAEDVVKEETDQEIRDRLTKLFTSLERFVELTVTGRNRALIITGDPGLSKSHTVKMALDKHDPKARKYSRISGFATGTGLAKGLWDTRHKGHVLVLDDVDSIYEDEKCLNLLKIATDTGPTRTISYVAEGTLISDKDNSRVDKNFTYQGSVIFITNVDLDRAVQTHRLGKHIDALMNRAEYIDVHMKDRREAMLRIEQVIEGGMLNELANDEKLEIVNYMRVNRDKFRQLSLRTATKIAELKKNTTDRNDWAELAFQSNVRIRK